jgi:hypothetical protein
VGDIIVDGDDIYGDGVNIAARLEGIAILSNDLSNWTVATAFYLTRSRPSFSEGGVVDRGHGDQRAGMIGLAMRGLAGLRVVHYDDGFAATAGAERQ